MQTLTTSERSKNCSAVFTPKSDKQPFFASVKVQPKLTIGAVDDPYEREADAMAEKVMNTTPGSKASDLFFQPVATSVLRKCANCKAEEKLQRKNKSSSIAGTQAPSSVHEVINSGGQTLDAGTRNFFEPRFGHDFSNVRIHTNPNAAQSASDINALAYTTGNNIVFNKNQFSPDTNSGKRLLAHELTHVVQQSHDIKRKYTAGLTDEPEERIGIGGIIQRDLAVEPPDPMESNVVLTDAQMRNAIRWNQRRFHDPFNIMNVRDVIGIPKYPAVIDEEFVNAVLRWQAGQGLEQDGKFGATSTQSVVGELAAEGSAHEAETLALDNTVDTVDVAPQTYNTCAAGLPFEFDWRVGFRTTLRNGFIIQKIDNVFNAAMCGGGAYTGWRPVPHYWEAWRVDGNGNVIPALGGVNDMFTRPLLPNSSGNWSMVGTLYTTRTLPASFVLNSVPDAGNLLRSTLNDPGSDFLGYVAARRRVGGTWNCCAAPPTHVRS